MITEQNILEYNSRGILRAGDIITNRQDYWGQQYFRKVGQKWLLSHDSDEMRARIISKQHISKHYKPVTSFLQELEKEYEVQYQKYLKHLADLERQRLETERKARVEDTRQKVIAQARSQGYVVKQKQINGKIQLMCTRSV